MVDHLELRQWALQIAVVLTHPIPVVGISLIRHHLHTVTLHMTLTVLIIIITPRPHHCLHIQCYTIGANNIARILRLHQITHQNPSHLRFFRHQAEQAAAVQEVTVAAIDPQPKPAVVAVADQVEEVTEEEEELVEVLVEEPVVL